MPTFQQAKYQDFIPNPQALLRDEFNRLAKQRNWTLRSKRYRMEWLQFVSEEFTRLYGNDERKLDGWQALCTEVGIREVPKSITKCKKALNGVWVNLVDLIDCRRTGRHVERHQSAEALRKYTISTGKIFPKDAAKWNGFLKALLIVIF